MICDICHKKFENGLTLKPSYQRQCCICPSCLMWSEDNRVKLARDIVKRREVKSYE